MRKHKHHIIPRYMGGSDDPSNLVELTVEEHAEAHRILWEKYGHWQDRLAWLGLLNIIDKDQIIDEMYKNRKVNRIPCTNFMTEEEITKWKTNMSKSRKGKPKSDKWKENASKRLSGSGNPMYGKEPWNKGKTGFSASLESKIKKGHPILYNGIEYYSIKEAARQNNISDYLVKKNSISISK